MGARASSFSFGFFFFLPTLSARTCLFPVHRAFSFLRSCVCYFLFALSYSSFVRSLPSQQFFSSPPPPHFNVHRQHGLAAACFIVSLGTAVGPILAPRGAQHGILLGVLLNVENAEMRTCGGGRGLVYTPAAPHRAKLPPRGLATTAVFLLGAQHWLGSCLFFFFLSFGQCASSSRNGCVYCASVESMRRLCFHMRVCACVCVCVDPGQRQTKYFFLRVECVGRRLHHHPQPLLPLLQAAEPCSCVLFPSARSSKLLTAAVPLKEGPPRILLVLLGPPCDFAYTL